MDKATAIAAAWAGTAPVWGRWEGSISSATFGTPLDNYEECEEGQFCGVCIERAVTELPDGEYSLSTYSNTSGYSPRFNGIDEQYLLIRDKQFRIVGCKRSGGTVATWGYKSPYETYQTEEDVWYVEESHPWIKISDVQRKALRQQNGKGRLLT